MNLYIDSVHLHIGDGTAIVSALGQGVAQLCATLTTEGQRMSEQLDRLTREVAETKTVQASAVALIHGLAGQIRDHLNDTAALTALADELDASEQTLGQAVQENTPPAPPA